MHILVKVTTKRFVMQLFLPFSICLLITCFNFLNAQSLAEISHELFYQTNLDLKLNAIILNHPDEVEIETSKGKSKVEGFESILYFQEKDFERNDERSSVLMEVVCKILEKGGNTKIHESVNEVIYRQKGKSFKFINFLIPAEKTLSYELIHFNHSLESTYAYMLNPSFENVPKLGRRKSTIGNFEEIGYDPNTCSGWEDLGSVKFKGESPYDVHSGYSNYFKCAHLPSDGITYVGLVTRENGAVESVGTKLIQPLSKKSCYNISIDVAHSYSLESATKRDEIDFSTRSFKKPVILRVKLKKGKAKETFTVYESEPIINEEWETLNFSFEDLHDFDYLILECDHSAAVTQGYYNGNLLLDNITFLERECK